METRFQTKSKSEVNLSFGLKPDFRVQFRLWSKTESKTWFKRKDKVAKYTL